MESLGATKMAGRGPISAFDERSKNVKLVKLLAKEGGIVPERLLFARLRNTKLVVPRELGMEPLRRQEERSKLTSAGNADPSQSGIETPGSRNPEAFSSLRYGSSRRASKAEAASWSCRGGGCQNV
jgi:hypothetical protein